MVHRATPRSATAEEAILDADRTWVRAFNQGDVERLTSIYAPDVILMPPGEPEVIGRPAAHRWLTGFLATYSAHQQLDNVEVARERTLGFVRGHFALRLTHRQTGEILEEHGKHLVIWRQGDGGSWLAWRDIWNTSPR